MKNYNSKNILIVGLTSAVGGAAVEEETITFFIVCGGPAICGLTSCGVVTELLDGVSHIDMYLHPEDKQMF